MYKIFSKPNGCIIPSNMLTVADIIIIATLLSGAFISPFLFSFNRDKAEFVSITDVSIMKTENYPLNEIRYINIECGGYCFYVEINDGEVLIKESNCPNQICAKTPPIKKMEELLSVYQLN